MNTRSGRDSVRVTILSDLELFAEGVQYGLEAAEKAPQCRIIHGVELLKLSPAGDEDILLLIPRTWEEMKCWRKHLQERFAANPWFLLAELWLAGAFLESLVQRCALAAPTATPDEIRTTFWALVEHPVLAPAHMLHMLFVQGVLALPPAERFGERPPPVAGLSSSGKLWIPVEQPPAEPTPKELICACAVSLGLSDAQIADLIDMGVSTVKTHIHDLLVKFLLVDRKDLARYVRRVLAP